MSSVGTPKPASSLPKTPPSKKPLGVKLPPLSERTRSRTTVNFEEKNDSVYSVTNPTSPSSPALCSTTASESSLFDLNTGSPSRRHTPPRPVPESPLSSPQSPQSSHPPRLGSLFGERLPPYNLNEVNQPSIFCSSNKPPHLVEEGDHSNSEAPYFIATSNKASSSSPVATDVGHIKPEEIVLDIQTLANAVENDPALTAASKEMTDALVSLNTATAENIDERQKSFCEKFQKFLHELFKCPALNSISANTSEFFKTLKNFLEKIVNSPAANLICTSTNCAAILTGIMSIDDQYTLADFLSGTAYLGVSVYALAAILIAAHYKSNFGRRSQFLIASLFTNGFIFANNYVFFQKQSGKALEKIYPNTVEATPSMQALLAFQNIVSAMFGAAMVWRANRSSASSQGVKNLISKSLKFTATTVSLGYLIISLADDAQKYSSEPGKPSKHAELINNLAFGASYVITTGFALSKNLDTLYSYTLNGMPLASSILLLNRMEYDSWKYSESINTQAWMTTLLALAGLFILLQIVNPARMMIFRWTNVRSDAPSELVLENTVTSEVHAVSSSSNNVILEMTPQIASVPHSNTNSK